MGLRSRLTGRFDAAVAWRANVAVGERIDRLEHEVGELRGSLDGAAREAEWATNELARITPQLASLEVRLEDAWAHLAGGGQDATAAGHLTAAGDELAAVRLEHERVRVRLALVSSYEERLRRLEAVSGR